MKSLFSRTKAATPRASSVRLSSNVKSDLLTELSGVDDGIPVTEAQAMSVPAFALSVGLISELISQLPLRLMRRTEKDVEVVTDHQFYDVWDMPAGASRPSFTGMSMTKWSLQKALIFGNAYIRIWHADNGKIVRRLEPIDPRRVTLEVTRGEVVYKIAPSSSVQGDMIERRVKPKDIIHIRGRYLDAEGYCGVSALQILKTTLKICLAQNRHARDSLIGKNIHRWITVRNDNPEGGGIDDETAREIEQQFNIDDNSVPVIDDSVEVHTEKMLNTELQFSEGRAAQILEISRVMGVPPPLVHHLAGVTAWGSGLNNILSMFIKGTLLPWAAAIEGAMGATLLTRDERKAGYYFDFDMSALYRGEAKDRALIYRQLVDGGLMSVAEARRQEGFSFVDGTEGLLPPKSNPPITEPKPKSEPGEPVTDPEDTPSDLGANPPLRIVK